ncbi:MAG: PcfJ domain-containing protein [Bacillota bacterium]
MNLANWQIQIAENNTNIAAHFPDQVSEKLMEYVIDVVFLNSRYIFTQRKGKLYAGFCTHCKQDFRTERLKHKSFTVCPRCQSKCQVRSSGMSRKFMQDDAYFVFYEKSLINPKAIIARGFYAKRDYSGDFRKVKTQLNLEALYLFEPGKGHFYYRPYYFSRFEEKRSVYSLSSTGYQNIRTFCSKESIEAAVKDTLFQYSTWEMFYYSGGDMLKFFDLVSRYPCIEYLSKLGLNKCVEAKLYGRKTYNAINWRGKTIDQVLRLSKQNLKEALSIAHMVDPLALRLFQIGKKDGSNLTIEEATQIGERLYGSLDELNTILRYSSLRRAWSYLTKQIEKERKNRSLSFSQMLTQWRDYLRDCITLELDLHSDSTVFPRNLYRAHQNTIKQVKIKANQELDKQIAIRVKALSELQFELDGLFLRPALSSQELIDEGKMLKHCVGTYAERYAKGQTSLFVLRKKSEPDKPFYTVEVKENRINQAYGRENCLPTKEVQAFIDAFRAEKLVKKSKERKVAV